MEERGITEELLMVMDISRQYIPITATDINRYIMATKATSVALLITIVGTVIGVEGIGMVDISISMEDIGILGVGINTSMADTAAVAIEEVIIVDDFRPARKSKEISELSKAVSHYHKLDKIT